MVTKLVKWQLIIFAIIGALAIVYVGANYARLPQMVGIGQYKVNVPMNDAGGIFPNAEVTYRGVPVGRVGKMDLQGEGMNVQLDLDSGAPKIPASAKAVVTNRSAIGEQFIDLQPTSNAGPYLKNGDTIKDYAHPPVLQDVMSDTIELTKSVPHDDLNTVVTELGLAFNGRSQDMSRLLDSLTNLAQSGHDNLSETISLIQNADVILQTQAEQKDEILEWSKGLDKVTATLASSDPAVRRILSDGPRTATELSNFLNEHGEDTTKLVHQLGETIHHVEPASFATGATFAMLSALGAGGHSAAPGDSQIHFGIVLETNNPRLYSGLREHQGDHRRGEAEEPELRHQLRRLPVQQGSRVHGADG